MTLRSRLANISNGGFGYSGDGGPATSAAVFATKGVLVTSGGDLLFSDPYGRVRAVTGGPTGPAAPTRAG